MKQRKASPSCSGLPRPRAIQLRTRMHSPPRHVATHGFEDGDDDLEIPDAALGPDKTAAPS